MLSSVQIPLKDPIASNPRILGGTPVFKGTRVPASLVADLLSRNYTLDIIKMEYPQLSRKQLEKFLKLISSSFDASSEK